MTLTTAALLGILQGITEFIPVSSSGHLALARAFLGYDLDPGITFEIVVHFGSFCSIAVFFRRELGMLVQAVVRTVRRSGGRLAGYTEDSGVRLVLIILLSMVPAGLVGVTMKSAVERAFVNPALVGAMLLVTGALLFSTRFVRNPSGRVTARKGVMIGVAQAVAILPGISRSGSTISAGLWLGVNRDEIARFSFLMVLPILAGAMLLETIEVMQVGEPIEAGSLVVGFLTSFVTGYLALGTLIALLKREKMHYFAYYCWALGAGTLVYFLGVV